jgi:hypothetical protein
MGSKRIEKEALQVWTQSAMETVVSEKDPTPFKVYHLR